LKLTHATTATMNFTINPKIFTKYPGLQIGVVIAKNLTNDCAMITEIQKQLRQQEKRIRETLLTETLSQQPKIKIWRHAYSAFGAKPKDNLSSVENLYRTVLRDNSIRHINNLVDIYNLISLKHLMPVGGEDLDKIKGDINLTFAGADESPVLLLGDKEPRPPHEGEVIYKDDLSAICRRWNWREADRTKLTPQTKNCILVIEALPLVAFDEIKTATEELNNLVAKYCSGILATYLLKSDKNIIVI